MIEKEIVDLINLSLAEEFELDSEKLVPEARLSEDLELDSLDRVDMVIVLENAFRFKIKDEEEIRKINTLGDIYEYVIKKEFENQGILGKVGGAVK